MKPRKNIAELSRELALRTEVFCRHFFPNGHKQSNYWQIGDTSGARGQSLAIRLKDSSGRKAGNWNDYATGEWGDLIDLLHEHRGNTNNGDTLREIRSFLGETPVPETSENDDLSKQSPVVASSQRIVQGRKLFNLGRPVLATLGDTYLKSRAIERRGPALRFHPTVFLRGKGEESGTLQKQPALLAKITDNEGRITGCARTFLNASTGKLAEFDNPKRVLGQLHGNAIRFGSGVSAQDLIVGEGLENVLSVGTALPEFDLASCLTANHLSLFIAPSMIKRIWIARDGDKVGEQAAIRLRKRLEPNGFLCVDLVPELEDFNKDLLEHGKEALRHRLLKAMKEEGLSLTDR